VLDVFVDFSKAANSEVNKEATTKIGVSSGDFHEEFGRPVWICAGPGGQGNLLPELQDGAGLDIGDRFQRKRAEDEDKGGVQAFVIVVPAPEVLIF